MSTSKEKRQESEASSSEGLKAEQESRGEKPPDLPFDQDFGSFLVGSLVDAPSEDALRRILLHQSKYASEISSLREQQPSFFKRLLEQAEEDCIHFKQPLMHRRKNWYRKVSVPTPKPQGQLGGYTLLQKFREGSMESVTYVAVHPDGYLCLLKKYFPKAVDLLPKTMFAHQERMIQRLNETKEPKIEEVLEHFLSKDGTYIQVKPYLHCRDLWNWLDVHPDRRDRVLLLREIARILLVLHDAGIAHMDLKPDQFLMLIDPVTGNWAKGRDFVLIDYDFSMVDGKLTLSVGSVPYYAPEQFDGKTPMNAASGVKADIYAFCVLVHRLLAEHFPFGDGRTEQSSLEALKANHVLQSMKIPYKPLEELLSRGIQPDPALRPELQEILDVLNEPTLLDACVHFSAHRSSASMTPSMFRKRKFPLTRFLFVFFVCILVVMGGFWLDEDGMLPAFFSPMFYLPVGSVSVFLLWWLFRKKSD